jgi:hypothetical protein
MERSGGIKPEINNFNTNKIKLLPKGNQRRIRPIKPVIVCLAKLESDYISEFIDYHLNLGFETVYLYDNEDKPLYQQLLTPKFGDKIVVTHTPGNTGVPIQFQILRHFMNYYIDTDNITHVAHIDIDEFVCLKKHQNIKDFINEYITTDQNKIKCAGIVMNWRFFGSSNHTEKSDIPVTQRFTKCEKIGNDHVKTLFNKELIKIFETVHSVIPFNPKEYPVKTTGGEITDGPFNKIIDFSVIQLNHYKCKTLPEFRYIRTRGTPDQLPENYKEDIDANYHLYDINEMEELTAQKFYAPFIEPELGNPPDPIQLTISDYDPIKIDITDYAYP